MSNACHSFEGGGTRLQHTHAFTHTLTSFYIVSFSENIVAFLTC